MGDAELAELADDIRKNGLMEPVVLCDDMVLDGRNRLRACAIAGVSPHFETHDGDAISPVIYVLSKNLHRRHLTTSQRAAIGAEALDLFREEAKKRQVAAGTANLRHESAPIDTNSEFGRSRDKAAELVGVGASSIARAADVKRERPDLFEKIKSGEITAYGARREISESHVPIKERKAAIPVVKSITTPRQKQLAEAQKRKMIDGVSLVSGVCHGLEGVDVGAVLAVCNSGEVETWASKIESHSRDLRKFANKLRGLNGKSEPSKDGEDAGGCSSNSPQGAACTEPELSQAAD